MNVTIRFTCLVALCAVLSGCGLIAYPHRTQLPPPHFQTITVCDAASRLPLTNAKVRLQARYIKNWARLTPPLRAQLGAEHFGDSPRLILTAQQQSAGCYAFQPVHRSEWSHVLFPIGLPLGGIMHHYYDSSIVAESPEHSTVSVRASPHLPPSPGGSQASELVEFSDRVTIYLPRAKP